MGESGDTGRKTRMGNSEGRGKNGEFMGQWKGMENEEREQREG